MSRARLGIINGNFSPSKIKGMGRLINVAKATTDPNDKLIGAKNSASCCVFGRRGSDRIRWTSASKGGLSVSAEIGCEYCVAPDTVVAGMVKTPAEAVQSIRDAAPLADDRLAALSAFTRSLIKNRGRVPDAEQQAFLAAGFSTGQVLEVITIPAMNTRSNYANHPGDPPLDADFAAVTWRRLCTDCG